LTYTVNSQKKRQRRRKTSTRKRTTNQTLMQTRISRSRAWIGMTWNGRQPPTIAGRRGMGKAMKVVAELLL